MKLSGCILGIPAAVLALIAILFGVLWLQSAFSDQAQAEGKSEGRLVVGGCITTVGLALTVLACLLLYRGWRERQAEKPTTVIQKIELPGDLTLERLKCQSCGATLGKDNITVRAGAVIVSCPYCATSYEIEEAPKW